MAENKVEQIKELAKWIKDNSKAVKEEGKSIFIGIVEGEGSEHDCTVSFVGSGEALMFFHEQLEDIIKENADDLLNYFLKKMMED